MVLFDEDPTALLKETTNQFHIAPDRDSLSRISDSLTSLSTARRSRLDNHHAVLKSLSRRLNGLEEGRRWEEDRHDAGGHAERMLKMDTEKFRIAKGVSDAEIEGERLEGELAGLKTQLDTLEKQGVDGAWRRDSEGEDEVV
jgi:kinetochore protein Spc24